MTGSLHPGSDLTPRSLANARVTLLVGWGEAIGMARGFEGGLW